MLLVLFVGFVNLMLAHLTPVHAARVDRIYPDHVEGFFVADSAGKEIYAGSRNRLYYSSDFGQHWSHLGDLPNITLIKQIIPMGRRVIFLNTSSGFYGKAFLSTDSGHSFCECLPSTGAGNCASFIPETGTLYVASQNPFKLMRSEDSGFTWIPEANQLDTLRDPHVCSLLISTERSGMTFYISTSSPATIYCRSGREEAWQQCFTDPQKQNRELPLVTKWGNRLVACVASGPHGSPEKIYLSDDRGTTWRGVNCPFSIWGTGVNASDSKTMWVGNYGTYDKAKDSISLQYTQDEGRTWQAVPNSKGKLFWQLQVLADGTLYAATDFGLMRVKLNG